MTSGPCEQLRVLCLSKGVTREADLLPLHSKVPSFVSQAPGQPGQPLEDRQLQRRNTARGSGSRLKSRLNLGRWTGHPGHNHVSIMAQYGITVPMDFRGTFGHPHRNYSSLCLCVRISLHRRILQQDTQDETRYTGLFRRRYRPHLLYNSS